VLFYVTIVLLFVTIVLFYVTIVLFYVTIVLKKVDGKEAKLGPAAIILFAIFIRSCTLCTLISWHSTVTSWHSAVISRHSGLVVPKSGFKCSARSKR
jgi:hypothetical protein